MNPDKIDRLLMEEMAARTSRDGTVRGDEGPSPATIERDYPIIVAFEPTRGGTDAAELAALGLGEAEMEVERTLLLFNGVAGYASKADIYQISEGPFVRKVYYDEPVYAMLDSSVPAIEVPRIWAEGNEGAGVRIAILDTGIDPTHRDFQGRILAEKDLTDENDPTDLNGHGTHVASIAAGSGEAEQGKYRGVAPKASLLIGKVLRADGTGRMSMVMAGIDWAVTEGAQLINLSLGTRGSSDGNDPTCQVVNRAVEEGVVVVAAAGNEGPDPRTIGSPGAAARAITIGAVSDDGTLADFSSRGPTLDGRTKPDFVLTGVSITAARAHNTALGKVVDDLYTTMRGTSMATPHASGVIALMLAADPTLTPASIASILAATARSHSLGPNIEGSGMIQPVKALERVRALKDGGSATPTPTPMPHPAPQSDNPGCLGALTGLFRR